jgi:RpiB/LacA/LacB family sugar-phosphate isomerase
VVRVAIASDHAGFALKQALVERLGRSGHAVSDLGTDSEEPVDYPDYAAAAGRAVQEGKAERAILVCGSGAGAAIAANKLRGIRAAMVADSYTAHQCVEHDDANVMALAARVIGVELAWELVTGFLAARFRGEERHLRRLQKVKAMEA